MITLNQMDLIMYESSIEEAPDDTVLKTSTQRHEFPSFRQEKLRKFTT
jgi:hypothetical protein